MKQILPSLQWLKEASTTLHPHIEQLRRHANSIEAMAQAWLKVPAAQMSTGQQLIAALDIIERLSPERHSEAKRLESALRMRQRAIHEHYNECRLERDAEQYDIENRAAFFGPVEKPRFADHYADVMITHAQAATGDNTIDNYLAASAALATIEARRMAEMCATDPMVFPEDNLFFAEKLLGETQNASAEEETTAASNENAEASTEENEKAATEAKPRRIRKQKTETKEA